MTTHVPPRPIDEETLDRVIDDTLQAMTGVDGLEARSRAQVQARLADAARRPASGPAPVRGSARLLAPWAAGLAAASILAALAFLLFDRAADDGGRSLAPPVRQAASDVRRVPQASASGPSSAVEARAAARQSASPETVVTRARSRSAASRSMTPRAAEHQRVRARASRRTQPADDRLTYVLQAIQQLPADAWTRLETAAPPTTPTLAPAGPAPIEPLSVGQLPGADFSVLPSTDTRPGEPR